MSVDERANRGCFLVASHQVRSAGLFALLITCDLVLATSGWTAEDKLCADQPSTPQKSCREALDLLLRSDPERPELTIFVTGRQYAWRYDYRLPPIATNSGPELTCATPGPLILPQGKRVHLLVTSEDLIHEWAIPSLGVQAEGIPGRLETVNFDTSKPGTFFGGATQTSGAGFRNMEIEVHVLKPNAYEAWEHETLRKTCQGSK